MREKQKLAEEKKAAAAATVLPKKWLFQMEEDIAIRSINKIELTNNSFSFQYKTYFYLTI